MYLCTGFSQNSLVEYEWIHSGYIYYSQLSRASITRQKKHIVTKDVVGLLLGEVVSIQKNIVKKDVVGLLLGEVVSMKKNTSSQKMWLAY